MNASFSPSAIAVVARQTCFTHYSIQSAISGLWPVAEKHIYDVLKKTAKGLKEAVEFQQNAIINLHQEDTPAIIYEGQMNFYKSMPLLNYFYLKYGIDPSYKHQEAAIGLLAGFAKGFGLTSLLIHKKALKALMKPGAEVNQDFIDAVKTEEILVKYLNNAPIDHAIAAVIENYLSTEAQKQNPQYNLFKIASLVSDLEQMQEIEDEVGMNPNTGVLLARSFFEKAA